MALAIGHLCLYAAVEKKVLSGYPISEAQFVLKLYRMKVLLTQKIFGEKSTLYILVASN